MLYCFCGIAAVLRGIASLADNGKNKAEKSGQCPAENPGKTSTKKRAAAEDTCTKPNTPSKVAKSSAEKIGAGAAAAAGGGAGGGAGIVGAPAVPSKSARQQGSSPLAAAIAEGEAAAAAASRPAALEPMTNSQTTSQAAGLLYSEGATKRLRDTLQQKRQGLESRLAALEQRSEHLENLTTAVVGVQRLA